MKRPGFRIVKNAASNLVRGGATALVALALPHFLTRALSTDRFAAWSLILQIAAYAGYLDFGLQTAIARFLAQSLELGQVERSRRLVNTALAMLAGGALLAFLVIGAVIANQKTLFSGIPASLGGEFQTAALLLTFCSALQLPFSAYTGVLVGMHRNELPALAVGASRIAGAAAAVLASRHTNSLVVLAACIGAANVIGGLVQQQIVFRLKPEFTLELGLATKTLAGELARYCAGLAIWSVGMLLVSGLDVTVVGYFQFNSVGYYSIAASLISFLAGLNSSAMAALLAPIAALQARAEQVRITEVILRATRINTLTNILLMFFLFVFGYPLVNLWCGPVYAAAAMPVIKILSAAQTLRLAMNAYSVGLISTGVQNRGIAPVMVEALVNLTCSLAGAKYLGAVGVAWGTLAGAVFGVLWVLARTMSISTELPISRWTFLGRGLLPPLAASIPAALCTGWLLTHPAALFQQAALFGLVTALSTLTLLWLPNRTNIQTTA